MTIALYAEFTANPGAEAAVHALLDEYASRVRAEPGNLRFDAHYIQNIPARIFVYEQYVDQEAFDTHLAGVFGHVFNIKLAPLVVGGGSKLTMLDTIGEANARS